MKLIYCTHSLYNPGGMERVLLNKVAWLRAHTDWEILIITTDQKQKPAFYPVAQGVRQIDLGINYSDDNQKNAIRKIAGYLIRKRKHKTSLSALLKRERADIVVSLYPSESSFIPRIKDGSKKVLELHFNKFFRLQYNRKGLLGLIDRWRTKQDERIVRRFDKFVVLTNEDCHYWGALNNIEVIPNAAKYFDIDKHCNNANPSGTNKECADAGAKSPDANKECAAPEHRIIAVGRLDYQKGFDRLIQAWDLVQQTKEYANWHLDIFGQGEWREMLLGMIRERHLEKTAHIHRPTTQIGEEYRRSAMLVMSSHYEGFPMVMVEAMACGLPVVSFDYKCGPKDIIRHGENGLLVKNGDIESLAGAMMRLMSDEPLRRKMSRNARNVVETYSEDSIMQKWMNLFVSLMEN